MNEHPDSPHPADAPLAGLRIIDFSHVYQGPVGTQILADFGADVIKVERPGSGDWSRAWGPFVKGVSLPFANLNRNKRSLTVDLKSEEGRELVGRFLAEAGLPDGVFNVVTGYGDPVGETFAAHEDVDMVSFTGSTAVGKRIVEASAGNLKKTALELGGKNPQIVFADGDLDAALDAVVFGVYFNMGECCNSSSRILVQSSIADAFMERVVARSKEVPVGDPLDESTKVGAIINQAQMDKIAGHIASGKQSGATLRLGGEPLASKRGRYFPPTVFDHVPPEAGIAREEIFGPVLSALRFDDADDALRLANDTCYGLSAGLWTSDLDTALRFSRGLRAGTVWVNTWMSGYPELAFGGYRQSGLGRELGLDAVREYCEPKTVQLHIGPRTTSWL